MPSQLNYKIAIEFIDKHHRTIRPTVAIYWGLGQCLSYLRVEAKHGDWEEFVTTKLKINLSRAARALRIFRNFKRVEDCQNLRLVEALNYRKRTPGKRSEGERP